MKLLGINSVEESKYIHFDSKRINRNAIKQLTKNNPFSLTEPNQRLISNAIEEMSNIKGSKNIKFLLDSAAKVTYATNIQNDIQPKHDWRKKLIQAALSAIAITPFVPKELKARAQELLQVKELSTIEKDIVSLKEQLLAVVDLEQINKDTNGPIRDFKKNLNYFVVSSETTLEHKKYVLERLNYFMSDDYEINSQLKDKKSIAIAEMVNDMTISVPGNEIPNIKAVDQKFHGMCGMISMVRKKLVYEDKPKYVDSIISELDNTDYISVYDRNHLGSGKKVNVAKVPVDFDAALRLGYRIIDASTLHWMQIASMGGASNIAYEEYFPFDKEAFDVRADRFYNTKIANENIKQSHTYYQALNKAKNVLEDYLASDIRSKFEKREAYANKNKSYKFQRKVYSEIERELNRISDVFKLGDSTKVISSIMDLEKNKSKDIKDNKFAYVVNEEFEHKKEKVKAFLAQYTKDEISDEKLKNLMELISYYKQISSKSFSSSSPIAKYLKLEKLYEIAAAFRHQIVRSLEIDENVDVQILDMGLPVKETFITETIDTLVNNLEKDSQYSEKIISQISENFKIDNDKEYVLNFLKELKGVINDKLNNEIDNIYTLMLFQVSKSAAMYKNIRESLQEIKNNNSALTKSIATVLGVKPSPKKLIKIMEKDLEELAKNQDSQAVYHKFLLKYGYASEISLLEDMFKSIINQMALGVSEEFVEKFVQINNINLEENPNAFGEKLEELQNRISSIKFSLKDVTEKLKVKDSDGEVLFSADPKDVILKELEYSYMIPDYKSMKELQAHKERVDKAWAKNEFGIRKDVRKDKSLFDFTKREVAALNLIEKNINNMYKSVQKELIQVRKSIKGPLEELAQIIGLNQGEYWVYDDQGGVGTAKMIRAVEYLTDRPHYSTVDYKKAVEKIKTSPYSGITSSFTRHNKGGMHALYVADIEPVKVKIKDENENEKTVEKDILFHDNTWGVREKDNTWIDSQGLTRTDYSGFQGGTLGYVTNSDYRNGNFVDRISDEMLLEIEPEYIESKAYRKIKPFYPSNYIRKQYDDVIIDGKSPELKLLAAEIHDTLFSQNVRDLKRLEKIAKSSTEEELQAEITKQKGYDGSWVKVYNTLKARIYGDMLNKQIGSKEEYDKLSDTDNLKVLLEKVALAENFSTVGMLADIVKIKDVKDLERFELAQKRRAVNSFRYSFAKSPNVVSYLAKEFNDEKAKGIEQIIDKHGIKLSAKEVNLLFPDFTFDTKYFNGSAKRTIDLVMRDISTNISKVIKSEVAVKEIEDYYRNFLKESLYFNTNNLERKDELNITALVDFIDRVFEPESDEELVKIYRKLQNMTTKEFNEKVLPKATYKDMGLKSLNGYDILKKLQTYEQKTITNFKNIVATEVLAPSLNLKRYNPEYVYKQLTRFAKVKEENDFKNCYNEINNSLSILTLEKLFNRYKDSGIRQDEFPAYPKTDLLNKSLFDTSFDSAINLIEGNIHKIKGINEQIENYDISHKLNKYINKLNPEDIPSEYQYKKINTLLGRLITLNSNDPAATELLEDAEAVLEFDYGTCWANYLPYVARIVNMLQDLENTTSREQLQLVIQNLKNELNEHQNAFVESLVQGKYQSRIAEDIRNLKQALIKNNSQEAELLKEKFYNDFVKAHILQNPTELLNTYLKSLSKDSKLRDYNKAYKALLERSLAYAKLAEIQELLMGAIKDATAINVKSVFDDIDVALNIGEYKMSSDEVIFVMVNSLLLDNNSDTALFFMDKLGLGEQYVRYVANNIKLEQMKEIVDNAHQLVNNWTKFNKDVNEKSQIVLDLLKENRDDFDSILNGFKRQIRKLAGEHNIEKSTLSILLEAIDGMKIAYNDKPSSKQLFIFSTVLNEAIGQGAQVVASAVANMNSILDSNSKVINLANGVLLHTNSDIFKQRQEFDKKFEELSKYSQSLNLQVEEDSDKI